MQLGDKTPRKKRKTMLSATLHCLDNPPQPSEATPAPVLVENLQDWGVLCNLSPSEVTLEAPMKRKPYDEDVAA